MSYRENFVSRIGFLMVVAGCAIGLGNVWRFPYITGESGGAIFVLFYLFFLVALGIPILMVELSIGRAAECSPVKAFTKLAPGHKHWKLLGLVTLFGLYVLMSYYSVITGWILYYVGHIVQGDFTNLQQSQISEKFQGQLNSPSDQFWCTFATLFIACLICYKGIQRGIEKFTKPAMAGLFILLLVLIAKAFSLEKANVGLEFFLSPNLENLEKVGLPTAIYNAMNQAFFTLSIGIGTVLAIAAYSKSGHSLLKEAAIICSLDTVVAIAAGLIIFPACFNYGITPDQGPYLIFITLLNMFNQMDNGIIWGSMFFFFLFIAALLTMIAVIESIIANCCDLFDWSRQKSSAINLLLMTVLSVPIVLSSNILAFIHPLGKGSDLLSLADFFVSNNMLPIGSLLMVIFCTSRYGWGWEKCTEEINKGNGIKIGKSRIMFYYFKYVLPVMILTIWTIGYYQMFFK